MKEEGENGVTWKSKMKMTWKRKWIKELCSKGKGKRCENKSEKTSPVKWKCKKDVIISTLRRNSGLKHIFFATKIQIIRSLSLCCFYLWF